MGKKGRGRQRGGDRRTAGQGAQPWAGPAPGDSPEQVVSEAVDALVLGREGGGVDLAAARLADAEDPARAGAADRAVRDALLAGVASAWARGWQPAETVRQAGRVLDPVAAAVCADAVTADLDRHSPDTVDPRWTAQVRELGAAPAWGGTGDYLAHVGAGHGLLRFEAVETALRLLAALRVLPPLHRLCPPPGAFRPRPEGSARTPEAVDQGKLARVRALLAKAESTEFPSEAEALSARAQELMARHSIDRALLAEEPGQASEAASGRRLPVDAPYDEHKAVLLHEVAEANHCRAVWDRELGLCTVMGFPGDVEAVDLMFTSLLVQAETAMRASGSVRDRSGRAAGRAFRASFMSAFSVRVGERLVESARSAEEAAAAETGTDLVPVFAAREREVEAAVAEAFGELTYSRVRGPASEDGWYEGLAAADAASLGAHRRVADR
ncbi:DUF2786 domain-containing protein [Nocardiopsis dassonvillei]|uniref:Uncharacterized protein n=1 Tax=Nocardiopsis dassonvillei (strain ATCC 23218 / DSM 43111 / CIP 107115 / JCM 7437 / KCTC 9190 / NBRC 14626 / NCTC 10488 / NRRL B-5397 / IMRU 509) TaxID=446468 RepID=D7AXW2_NOCDD|nr:DUF2786 domain-containing protein [Nocardiopsis dassonvillei]ADH68016.1 conserved hypothetical protein [Nocardiopsis dassonvillei subsp. dassonvillei DSM 43111]VEI88515.1 Protein of uncharacterised function (DUF2786) [Nocardiopsis dassonvillei]